MILGLFMELAHKKSQRFIKKISLFVPKNSFYIKLSDKKYTFNVPSSLTSNQQEKKLKKHRTTLKEEIEINQQFQQKIPKYFVRKNFDLMRIVEDQVGYFF